MSKRILAISILAIASFFVACSQDDAVPDVSQSTTAGSKTVPIVQVDQFTAPADSSVTADQVKKYAKASAALVELGVRWSERIDNANDAEKVQILNAYNVARDQLCARVGLAGIAEYNWITTVAMPNAKNKEVFEAAGVKILK